jgi:hypothetical protein
MYRILSLFPVIAMCLCTLAHAETTAVRTVSRTTTGSVLPPMYYETGRPVFSQVSYNMSNAPSCGADSGGCMESPGCWDGIWDDYCCQKRCKLRTCGSSFLKRSRCNSGCSTGCNSCDSGCSTCSECAHGCNGGCDSCDSFYSENSLHCGCGGSRWGFQGCQACCRPCYKPQCKPIRCWANGWCGEMLDGYSTGHPPCAHGNSGGDVHYSAPHDAAPMPAESNPVPADMPPMPMPAAPMPERAAKRGMYTPASAVRFTRGAVIK